jgi:hypothetical protein
MIERLVSSGLSFFLFFLTHEIDREREWECSVGGGLSFLGFSLLVSAKLR